MLRFVVRAVVWSSFVGIFLSSYNMLAVLTAVAIGSSLALSTSFYDGILLSCRKFFTRHQVVCAGLFIMFPLSIALWGVMSALELQMVAGWASHFVVPGLGSNAFYLVLPAWVLNMMVAQIPSASARKLASVD